MCLCECYKTYYTQLREGLKRSKVNISENIDEVRLCVCVSITKLTTPNLERA